MAEQIDQLPAWPDRSKTSAEFIAEADALGAALPTAIAQMNAVATEAEANAAAAGQAVTTVGQAVTTAGNHATTAGNHATTAGNHAIDAMAYRNTAEAFAASAINAPGTSALSTTSLTPGIGSRVFTLTTEDKSFGKGQRVRAVSDATPLTKYMEGYIEDFTDPVLTVEVDTYAGGAASDWVITLAGGVGSSAVATGGEIAEGDVDIVLTAASAAAQAIHFTEAGHSVYAPDATTLTKGPNIFTLENYGVHGFYFRDHVGSPLVYLATGDVVSLDLVDNDDADGAGTWIVRNGSATGASLTALRQGGSLAYSTKVPASAPFDEKRLALSDSRVVIAYRTSGSDVLAIDLLDVSDPAPLVLSSGTIATLGSTSFASNINMTWVSSTRVAASWNDEMLHLDAVIIDFTGDVVTVQTAGKFRLHSGGIAYSALTANAAGTRLIALYSGSPSGSNYYFVRMLAIAGSTITAAAAAVTVSGALLHTAPNLIMLEDGALAIGTVRHASGGVIGTVAIGIAGDVLTPSAWVSDPGGLAISNHQSLQRLSNTKALVVSNQAGGSNKILCSIITVTGGTPAFGTHYDMTVTAAVNARCGILPSGDRFVTLASSSANGIYRINSMILADGSIVHGTPTLVKTSATQGLARPFLVRNRFWCIRNLDTGDTPNDNVLTLWLPTFGAF